MPNELQVFLVGGAVRDELLGIPLTDKDFVVVGSTAEELSKLGFKPVGKDFPVFLHPQTGDEYALARTERKKGQGHQGFVFYTHPSVTLEEAVEARGLTMEALDAWAVEQNRPAPSSLEGEARSRAAAWLVSPAADAVVISLR